MSELGIESSTQRLGEILGVLRRHNLHQGITPERLKSVLEDLGPIYVKIGQIMSMRSDILPPSYCLELGKLHTDVRPMSPAEVEGQIRMAYGREVGEIFESIDPAPSGSASIAQVHKAKLLDGRTVAVKVQRPNIQEIITRDIALLRRAARVMGRVVDKVNNLALEGMLDEIWLTMQQETDFILEAEHLQTFTDLNKDINYIACPLLEHSLVTPKVFVMEFVEGIPIDQVDQLKAAGYDLDEIGAKLAENYIKQMLDDGFFHADPHPGNLIIRDGRIVWLDLGMVGRLSNRDRIIFKEIALAMVRNDTYELKDLLLTLGDVGGELDHAKFHAEIDMFLKKYGIMDLGQMDFGKLLQDMMYFVQEHDIIMPSSMTTMGRGLMNLEGLLSRYCPNVNILTILTFHLIKDWQKVFDSKKEIGRLGLSLYGFFSKSVDLPSKISDVLEMTIKGQTKLNLSLNEAKEPIRDVARMVNKLVLAIVVAALLVSSSLLCTTNMSPQFWDVPLLGLIGYGIALLLTIWLCYGILRKKS